MHTDKRIRRVRSDDQRGREECQVEHRGTQVRIAQHFELRNATKRSAPDIPRRGGRLVGIEDGGRAGSGWVIGEQRRVRADQDEPSVLIRVDHAVCRRCTLARGF